jgi:hypothetical protein
MSDASERGGLEGTDTMSATGSRIPLSPDKQRRILFGQPNTPLLAAGMKAMDESGLPCGSSFDTIAADNYMLGGSCD